MSDPLRPIRLVILLQDLAFGGSQTQALELARGLDPARFQVEMWTLMRGDGLLPRARQWGIPVRALGQGGYVWPPALFGLGRALASRRPELLLLYTGIPNIWGRILGRLAGLPLVVATCRGSLGPRRQHERLLWPLAHHHLCNSRALKDLLVERYGVPAARISVIPNGVDTTRFRPRPAWSTGEPLVLALGRMSPEKGQADLIAAFGRIASKHPSARLWLVGDGPERGRLAALARSAPGSERIRLLPAREEVAPLLEQASLLALPSRHEGLPNAVLEAMAAGLPVAASRLPGLAGVVVHERNGLLATPGDVPALARALDRLLGNPAQARAWGRLGRRMAEQDFSLAAMVRAHETIFERLLAQRLRPRREG